uniref:GDP-mannose 4,6-dehydratase n=1 Tax=Candidatus Methanogaster sp. ANME-2c ERB4 TaxID=2759911 RepID=A0A7G9YE96_9EURY|nr:GDP-mannose 4,6-dehydratase [Methanosarcinales archaeon ANME-2c ERB4]
MELPGGEDIGFVKGSILVEVLKRVFKEGPDYVFHLAAHFANQNSVDNPEYDLNGVGALKVLQYAHLVGVERLVYSSSGCGVYGLDSKIPFEGHDVSISPHTPYQVTKLLGQLYTNYFYNPYGLAIVNARFFNAPISDVYKISYDIQVISQLADLRQILWCQVDLCWLPALAFECPIPEYSW